MAVARPNLLARHLLAVGHPFLTSPHLASPPRPKTEGISTQDSHSHLAGAEFRQQGGRTFTKSTRRCLRCCFPMPGDSLGLTLCLNTCFFSVCDGRFGRKAVRPSRSSFQFWPVGQVHFRPLFDAPDSCIFQLYCIQIDLVHSCPCATRQTHPLAAYRSHPLRSGKPSDVGRNDSACAATRVDVTRAPF